MKAVDGIRYDEQGLREAAGEKVFARGRYYADQYQVTLLSAGANGVLAVAFGTTDYTVWLNRPGPKVSGHCTCPAFEGAGLCKHMVATALLANQAAEAGEDPSDSIGKVAGQIAMLDRQQLEKLLLDMVTTDWRTLRSLHLVLDLDWEDDLD